MDDEIKKMLGEILQSVKGLEARVTTIEGKNATNSSVSPASPVSEKRMSIGEFLLECAPTNGVQTTLAIAYFIEKYEGVSPFNAADIKKAYRTAKETIPKNINDNANMCVKNKDMMEEPEKKDSLKAWVVTRRGVQFVENKFNRA
jgi:hypothetical protein